MKSYPQKFRKFAGMMISNPERVDLCMNGSIDAISSLGDGFVYIFKGEYYFRFEMGKPIDYAEYPKQINDTFHGLDSNLDTVLTIGTGKTYFFKVGVFKNIKIWLKFVLQINFGINRDAFTGGQPVPKWTPVIRKRLPRTFSEFRTI